MVGTPKNPPARHKTFGISDSLLDAARKVQENNTSEAYMRPKKAEIARQQARKSDVLKSKDSVASAGSTSFKKRHAGKTVPNRAGTAGVPKSTGAAGDLSLIHI